MRPNRAQVEDALASISRAHRRPLIEMTLGPADVLGAKRDCEALHELNRAIMAVSARKDREYRAAQESGGLLAMLAVVGWAAFVVAAGVAVWR